MVVNLNHQRYFGHRKLGSGEIMQIPGRFCCSSGFTIIQVHQAIYCKMVWHKFYKELSVNSSLGVMTQDDQAMYIDASHLMLLS